MANYLVTGGAGFIGSHLTEKLLKCGSRVSILDNLSSGRLLNIAHLRGHRRLKFVEGSVADSSLVAELVAETDVVFHLAASVGVFNILRDPASTVLNNVFGAQSILAAAAAKRKKVVVFSSSEVYGKSAELPFREDGDSVLGPSTKLRWCYASSKLVDEVLALAYWRQQSVPVVVVRLFNTIGPRQVGSYGMVIPRFFDQARRGETLTVYGDGEQTRCFTDVSDVVEWLIRLANSDQAVGEIFNLGNPTEISINDLARRVIALTGAPVNIEHISYADAYVDGFEDMARRVPSIAKVEQLTGYSPQISLDEALDRIHNWILSGDGPQISPARAGAPALTWTPSEAYTG